ncbi:unnamed protein product, partial [marine sediment metagenome]
MIQVQAHAILIYVVLGEVARPVDTFYPVFVRRGGSENIN